MTDVRRPGGNEDPADYAGALSSPGEYPAPATGATARPVSSEPLRPGNRAGNVVGMQPDPIDRMLETPIDDAVEQSVIADPVEAVADDDFATDEIHRGLEVSEWDATEQARTGNLTDDYD
jgi:hypothetical protein